VDEQHKAPANSLAVAREVDALCDRFEAALGRGERPKLDDWLPPDGPARLAALVELVRVELEHRLRAGELVRADEYFERYPELQDVATLAVRLLTAEREGRRDFTVRPPQGGEPAVPAGDASATVGWPGPDDAGPGTAVADGDVLRAAQPRSAAPAPAHVPGYTVLGVLGRGAMGVVYKAYHLALKRDVALKMILAGGHAGPEELTRFRAEAESLARLRHANIVQVYEIGEHEGKPYFALEYLEDGSLAARLNGTPLGPTEGARLVETLARAMHAAHQRQIVHRDLKPSNVLLTADGTPKIADFGLAKRLDEAGQTQTGAVLGTPSYMAPEQAEGRSGAIGAAADVYALGAILYECLTGRPPFTAATTLETLAQVINDAPVPPRRLQSKTPRDLETICLKCLEKQPSSRYASAAALADDLRRFLAHEPIQARPSGIVGRAWKWARRRPAVAGLIAAVAAASALGAVGVAWQYGEAVAGRVAAEKEQRKATEALDRFEQSRADALLRPIGHSWSGSDAYEMGTVWEITTLPEEQERVRLLFIDRAVQRPGTAEQLGRRAQICVHAAVGLDRGRRAQVLKLLTSRLRDKGVDQQIRVAAALAAAELAHPDGECAANAAQVIIEAMNEFGPDPPNLRRSISLAWALNEIAPRLDEEAADAAGQRILQTMLHGNPDAFSSMTWSMAAVAPRMSEAEARKAAAEAALYILEAMSKRDKGPVVRADKGPTLPELRRGLECVGRRLDQAAASALAKRIMEILPRSDDPREVAEALEFIGAKLNKAAATAAVQRILREMGETTQQQIDAVPESEVLLAFAKSLAVIAPQMDEGEARQAAVAAGQRILEAMERADDNDGLATLGLALGAISPRMGETEGRQATAKAAQRILRELEGKPALYVPSRLSEALAAVARMDEGAARRAAVAVAQRIQKKEFQRSDLGKDGKALQMVAPWLSEEAASEAAQWILKALDRQTWSQHDLANLYPLAKALGTLSLRLEKAEARRTTATAAKRFLQLLENDFWSVERDTILGALAAVSLGLDEGEARQVANWILDAVGRGNGGVFMYDGEERALQDVVSVLTWQEMVELLKHPACVGNARKEVLGQLGRRLNHRFDNVWELVDWLADNAPDVDALSPPREWPHLPEPSRWDEFEVKALGR
jgi:hypothetical protein